MFPCEGFGFVIPLHVLLRLFDGGEECAHGLIQRALFDGEELCDSRGIREVTGKAVTRLGGVCDDASVFENAQSQIEGLWRRDKDIQK